ncbi:hypothetical protein Ddc_00186 [Ditylenchus destructor]|nr:hypothetical protein Ddc_00186 [Ditylenchus destructor]
MMRKSELALLIAFATIIPIYADPLKELLSMKTKHGRYVRDVSVEDSNEREKHLSENQCNQCFAILEFYTTMNAATPGVLDPDNFVSFLMASCQHLAGVKRVGVKKGICDYLDGKEREFDSAVRQYGWDKKVCSVIGACV